MSRMRIGRLKLKEGQLSRASNETKRGFNVNSVIIILKCAIGMRIGRIEYNCDIRK